MSRTCETYQPFSEDTRISDKSEDYKYISIDLIILIGVPPLDRLF